MGEPTFYIKQGATSPALVGYIQDEDGDPIDTLDGVTIKFRMRRTGRDERVIDQGAAVLDSETAKVGYQWREIDTEEPGYYEAEFVVDYDAGQGEDFEGDEWFPSTGYINIHIDETI